MTIRRFVTVAATVALSALALSNTPQPALAAVINWGSAQSITGVSDVITTGTLFASANFAGSNTTVNGVTFNAFPITGGGTSATVGNIGLVAAVGTGTGFVPASLTSSSPPWVDLPANYQNLLAPTLRLTGPGNQLTVTLSNLFVGGTYSIQYWVNDPRTNATGALVRVGGAVNLDPNTGVSGTSTAAAGGLGQWLAGQFVADATTQSFTVAPTAGSINVTYANAMQVRLLAVPEPSTVAVMGAAGGMATMLRLRRSRRAVAPATAV